MALIRGGFDREKSSYTVGNHLEIQIVQSKLLLEIWWALSKFYIHSRLGVVVGLTFDESIILNIHVRCPDMNVDMNIDMEIENTTLYF